jgi:hypothetical protein
LHPFFEIEFLSLARNHPLLDFGLPLLAGLVLPLVCDAQ